MCAGLCAGLRRVGLPRHQSIPQRKALKRRLTSPELIAQRAIYKQAREDIVPAYTLPKMLILLCTVGVWLFLSQFTAFRRHITEWLLTGVFPTTNSTEILVYVLGFLLSFAFFWLAIIRIEEHMEERVDRRYRKLWNRYQEETSEDDLTKDAPAV